MKTLQSGTCHRMPRHHNWMRARRQSLQTSSMWSFSSFQQCGMRRIQYFDASFRKPLRGRQHLFGYPGLQTQQIQQADRTTYEATAMIALALETVKARHTDLVKIAPESLGSATHRELFRCGRLRNYMISFSAAHIGWQHTVARSAMLARVLRPQVGWVPFR